MALWFLGYPEHILKVLQKAKGILENEFLLRAKSMSLKDRKPTLFSLRLYIVPDNREICFILLLSA